MPRKKAQWTVCGKVTKAVCQKAHSGQLFYSRTLTNADGSPLRVRVSGQCKTWKTRPDEFRIPVKYGMYENGYLTETNADQWGTTCKERA